MTGGPEPPKKLWHDFRIWLVGAIAAAIVGYYAIKPLGVLDKVVGDVWSPPPELEWLARPYIGCVEGSPELLFERAEMTTGTGAGIRGPVTNWEIAAKSQTFVCGQYAQRTATARDHLESLAGSFPNCFHLDPAATDAGDAVRGCFALDERSTALCSAPVRFDGEWKTTFGGKVTFFCMGENAAYPLPGVSKACDDKPPQSRLHGAPEYEACSAEQLRSVGVPEWLLEALSEG